MCYKGVQSLGELVLKVKDCLVQMNILYLKILIENLRRNTERGSDTRRVRT